MRTRWARTRGRDITLPLPMALKVRPPRVHPLTATFPLLCAAKASGEHISFAFSCARQTDESTSHCSFLCTERLPKSWAFLGRGTLGRDSWAALIVCQAAAGPRRRNGSHKSTMMSIRACGKRCMSDKRRTNMRRELTKVGLWRGCEKFSLPIRMQTYLVCIGFSLFPEMAAASSCSDD